MCNFLSLGTLTGRDTSKLPPSLRQGLMLFRIIFVYMTPINPCVMSQLSHVSACLFLVTGGAALSVLPPPSLHPSLHAGGMLVPSLQK